MYPNPTTDGRARRLEAGSSLAVLSALAREAGAEALAREALELAERVAEGRFYVGVVGQFKRGKSTLINALVGEALLPAGVVPVTAVVTVVRHGPERGARIRTTDGTWREIPIDDLSAYVSEAANPENEKGVAAVEVFIPCELLGSGMCLVDTPGLGSVFTGATEMTRAFVPQIDAALVVLGADPPISEDELDLLGEISRHVRRILIVLGKADRASDLERREARAFADRLVTSRLGRRVGPILEVSAAERLATGTPTRDWQSLTDALARLARDAGSGLVNAAERRGLTTLARRLRHEIDESRGALLRPVADSERRIETLQRCAADAERALHELGYLLTAEQDRLSRQFTARRADFLRRTVPAARQELSRRARELPGRGSPLRRRAIALAQELARAELDRWRDEEQPAAEDLYRNAAQRFVELANEFLERLASSSPELQGVTAGLGPELGFRVKSRLYYSELWYRTTRSAHSWLFDLFRARESSLRVINRQIGDYLERLLLTNATRIENDFAERVLESRRRLEAELRKRLEEVYTSAERALERASATLSAGEQAVRAELERLDTLQRRADTLITTSTQGEQAA